MYTLAEAAAACGINKTTVLRAIKTGRISGTRDDLRAWHVDAAELHRVFPPAASATASTDAPPRHATPDAAADALVAELRSVIADLRNDRDDLRKDRDRWHAAYEASQRLLPPSPAPAPVNAGGPLYRAWARWLRKAG